ncbi:MAG: GNAT family N-acetyltransferase [Acidimicrobiia bacterium]|nr:GNAT family N-acetyltransferase [Acidimicrobiia bacterium]
MTRLEMVQRDDDRLHLGTWRGDPTVALLTPVPGRLSHVDTVLAAVDLSRTRDGRRAAMTSALLPHEQEPFLAAGFTVRERLHLLRHDLTDVPDVGDIRLRRGWRRDYRTILDIDGQAFDTFWRFDRASLTDARSATPASRFRVADDGGVVGYAITGRASDTCYLQRLAVAPDAQRRGVGTALVVDALVWAGANRCTSALVNTQESNAGAYALYRRLGFTPEAGGLAVLEWRDPDPSP